MKAVKFTFKTLLILLIFTASANAQVSDVSLPVYNKFSLDLNAGMPSHFGDVKANPYWPSTQELSFGGGLGLNYHLSPVLSLRAGFLTGKLMGENEVNDWQFENSFMEYSLNTVFNFNQLFVPSSPVNRVFSVYGVLGVGVVGYRTTLSTFDGGTVLQTYGRSEDGLTNESREWDMVIPFGLGVRFRLSDRIDLGLESAFRYTKTDKLDGVNRVFSATDMYNYTSLGVNIRLGRNTESPTWAATMYPAESQRIDGMSTRFNEVQEDVVRIRQSMDAQNYDEDISELRQLVENLDKKNNELTMRLHNLQSQLGADGGASAAALLSVYFKINSAALDAGNYERTAAAARFMQANPLLKIEIVGHADNSGPDRFNRILSERRAQAVHDALVNDFRIDASRLTISFRGPDAPMSEENSNINRRVDFVIVE